MSIGLQLEFIDMQSTIDGDVVDLESGMSSAMHEQEGAKLGKNALYKGSNDLKGEQVPNIMTIHAELPVTNVETSLGRRDGEEKDSLLKLGTEKAKKKRCKKPPKPPRPPTSSPFDDADQKLIREISELAMMKRARIERMKKMLKNGKSSSSSGNLCAMISTILFCLLLILQGALSRGNSNNNHHGSPESSVRVRGGFISLQFNKDASENVLDMPHPASPIDVGPVTNLIGDQMESRTGGQQKS